jgi:hypothetical protein
MWTVRESFTVKAECDHSASVETSNEKWIVGQKIPRLGLTLFQCLPDTIDPRGPKGGN